MPDPQQTALRQIALVHGGDWAALAELYAEDVHYRDPDGQLTGRDAVLARLREQVEALPGWTYDVRAVHATPDAAVVEWVLRVPPDAPTPVHLEVATVYEVRDGAIVAERNHWDNVSLLTQLGLLPAGA
jgi:limonene-1,2-epoxide hydrolase